MYHKIALTSECKGGTMYPILNANKDRLIFHEFEQYRYLYFINQRLKANLLLSEKPYPKANI